jgi:hypothetical protein
VRDVINDGWDLLIGHPDCTYLTNSGVQFLHNTPNNPTPGRLYEAARWDAMYMAADFFNLLRGASIPRIALENPIPHKYAVDAIGVKYNQLVQPYQFGDPESKATCLWLKNLPPLVGTKLIPKADRKQTGHMLPPSPTRAHERSRTYQGIANAMAAQWGVL